MIDFSNIKINIGLKITEKRNDGYHNIESIFYPLPFSDIIEVIEASDFEYKNSGITVNCPLEQNTCFKAYQLIKNDFSQIPSIKIFHHKIIPQGMGLGGGSSNAITVLNLINQLFELQLSEEILKKYADKIGSDCNFFIHNQTAYVSGKGEQSKLIDFKLKDVLVVLLLPQMLSVNTAWAYSQIVPEKNSYHFELISQMPILEWRNIFFNDFEKPIFKKYPILGEAKDYLYNQGALYASLSGSGAALFGIFDKNKNPLFSPSFFKDFTIEKLIL